MGPSSVDRCGSPRRAPASPCLRSQRGRSSPVSAQDRQVSYKRIPAAWRAVANDLDRGLPANARAIVLPGELFSFYTWGGTVDPILPALSRRPVAERSEVPYSDLRAADLLWTIDGLVHQGRLLPGQLAPLLRLIGVRSVITATDSDLARSDAPAPADVAQTFATQPGFTQPAKAYGAVRPFTPTGDPAPGSSSRRSAGMTSRPPGGSSTSSRSRRRPSSTARRPESLRWPHSAGSRPAGRCSMPPTWLPARCAPRSHPAGRWSSPTPTAAGRSWPARLSRTSGRHSPPIRPSAPTASSLTRSAAARTPRPSPRTPAFARCRHRSHRRHHRIPSIARSPRSTVPRRRRGSPIRRSTRAGDTSTSRSRGRLTSRTSTCCRPAG